MSMIPKAAAIIVAGGQGTRFGGTVRKQYLKLGGRPLLWWSLQAFERSAVFGAVVVVVPMSDVLAVQRRMRLWGFSKVIGVVSGGQTRRESVLHGMKALPVDCSWLAVHDAVRPLVMPEAIDAVYKGAQATGAAIAACPSKDTVKIADDRGAITSTPPRDRVWLAQTPQIFRRDILEKAHKGSPDVAATDDAQLVEATGVHVKLIATSAENIKVTIPIDLKVAELILQRRKK
jgi:2-C-methyl-D-erythritol 4-phosphate cytidylyltransferase